MFLENFKVCETNLKNQKEIKAYFSRCLLTNADFKKGVGEQINVVQWETKTSQLLQVVNIQSYLQKQFVLSLEELFFPPGGTFSHPLVLQEKNIFHEANIFQISAFQMHGALVIKGVFKPSSSLNLPTNMGNH